MKPLPLAYVIPGHPRAAPAPGDRGACPRFEIDVFLERYRSVRLDYARLGATRGRLAGWLRDRGRLQWGLAAHCVVERDQYSAFLTTGEDVGLRLALLAVAAGFRGPILMITHGSFFGSPKFAIVASVARRMRNLHFLCLSESLRSRLVDGFGLRPQQVHNPSYGIDTSFFRPRGQGRTGRPLIVSAGTAWRDYRSLVRAVEGLDVDVRVAADSAWYRQPIDVSHDQLPSNITVSSAGDYANLRELYGQASFVVVPLREADHASGYAVIAEAMAMGKAVIATRTRAHGDMLEDGDTGFYVAPGDVEALRAKIVMLVRDPGSTGQMGLRGRERVERHYSLDAYCGRIAAVMLTAGASIEPL